eukprot:403355166
MGCKQSCGCIESKTSVKLKPDVEIIEMNNQNLQSKTFSQFGQYGTSNSGLLSNQSNQNSRYPTPNTRLTATGLSSTANNSHLQINDQSAFYSSNVSPRKFNLAEQYEKELKGTMIAEKQMARLAHEDIETFKQKQTEMIQKFDAKQLRQQRALPPISVDSQSSNRAFQAGSGAVPGTSSSQLQRQKTKSVPNTMRGQQNGMYQLNIKPQLNNYDQFIQESPGSFNHRQEDQEWINSPNQLPSIKKKKTNIQQDFFDLESKISSIQNGTKSIESYKRRKIMALKKGLNPQQTLQLNQSITNNQNIESIHDQNEESSNRKQEERNKDTISNQIQNINNIVTKSPKIKAIDQGNVKNQVQEDSTDQNNTKNTSIQWVSGVPHKILNRDDKQLNLEFQKLQINKNEIGGAVNHRNDPNNSDAFKKIGTLKFENLLNEIN